MRDSPESVIAHLKAKGAEFTVGPACGSVAEPDVGANATGRWELFTAKKLKVRTRKAEQTESEFLNQLLQYARIRRWRSAHFRPGMNRRGKWQTAVAGDGKGFFDVIFVRDRLLAVETKVGSNKLTPEQRDWFEAYKRAGVECYVWYPTQWDEIERVLS